jgi:DNA-binding Lrp family transcriptional regulator
VIKATVAALDGRKLGKPILAFIHVNTTGWGKTQEMLDLAQRPDVEEIHTVTGDTCLMLKVRTQDAQGLEDLLRVIYDIPGVQGTRSYIVLSSHLERGALPAD